MTSTPPAQGISRTSTDTAIAAALSTIRRNNSTVGARYPDDTTTSDRYLLRPAAGDIGLGGNRGWTTSFRTGQLWLAWELTGDDEFRDAALIDAADFERRVRQEEDLETHDLGFLYTLSTVAAWRLLGDQDARAASLLAADHLMRRFLEPAGIIQAWGDLSDPAQRGRTIIDSLMNMPLLTWAGEQTGEERFAEAVRRHSAQLREHILREDDSTFHTFYWDADTGEALRGATEQGAFDDSCWARGQAWGIYGFAMNFTETGDERLLEASRRCADYFLAHLPADEVPFWDLVYTDGSTAPRDSSAGAIAVCGLLELASVEIDQARAEEWTGRAHSILSSLVENYTPERPEDSDALLLHSVYDFPKDNGVDEGTLWGDYFFLEALMRVHPPRLEEVLVRLVSYRSAAGVRPGAVVTADRGDLILDLGHLGADVTALIADHATLAAARREIAESDATALPVLDPTTLAAPVTPGKILCLGYNYRGHVPDGVDPKADDPSSPDVFVKTPNTLAGPNDAVVIPAVATDADYEGELAVVIGRRAHAVSIDDALGHVAGYTILNDVSDRSWQRKQSQWALGKCFDGFAPLGPWLVTADAVADPQNLLVEVVRDGVVTVSQSTSTTVFPVAFVVHHLSQVMTLEPGDVISTGTPQKLAEAQQAHRPLAGGDAVTVRISGIGELTTTFIAPQEAAA